MENLTGRNVAEIIRKAEFTGAPKTGDCTSFAVALDRVFDCDGFPCAFDPFDDSQPLHAMAIYDGVVLDSDGGHGTDPEYVRNWHSGLKPNDFEWVMDTASKTGRDEGEVLDAYLKSEGFVVFNDSNILFNLGADEQTVAHFIKEIEAALDLPP